MKRLVLGIAVALATVCVAGEAFALSVSVDLPYSYALTENFLNSKKDVKPKNATVTDVNGFILGASAGWLGVGYEAYQVNPTGKFIPGAGPAGTPTTDLTMHVNFYDLFLDLPAPFIHFAVGVGKGRVNTEIKPVQGQTFHVEGADASQTFLRLGIPIGPLFDVHLGYSQVRVEDAKVPNGGNGTDKLKLSGNLLTAGVRLGW